MNQNMKDYYKILELQSNATFEQIKSQYRFLSHAWHPDKFPSEELKAKAEEKIKDINEAYSVLGDTTKREFYDRSLHTYSPPPRPRNQTPYSQPVANKTTQAKPKSRPKEYCESCGLTVQTKYVEFHENIGMLFARQHRAVKGNLCKSCIDFYFWNLTGKTMLLGWWSMSSVIIAPLILLNNLLRFIFTAGMKKTRSINSLHPSQFWVFSTIGGFLLISYFLLSVFSSTPTRTAQSAYSPSSTSVPVPTRVPTKVKTPTPSPPNCFLWNEITSAMNGRKVCVYGTVYSVYNTKETSTRIEFSPQPNTFFLYNVNHVYPDLNKGDCVAAEEVVQLISNIPYMEISNLYKCESWMK